MQRWGKERESGIGYGVALAALKSDAAKVIIASCEFGRGKMSLIRATAAQTTSAPTGINKLPFAMIDSNRIPGMDGLEWRKRIAVLECRVAIALPVTTKRAGPRPR